MWKCKHCKKEFDFIKASEKGNHTKWCDKNPNRNLTGKSISKLANEKILERWKKENPICKICNESITFERWRYGSKDFCGKSSCRSEINSLNSKKQDKTKISGYIKNSEKWITGQRNNLLKREYKHEISYHKALCLLYDTVERNVPIKYHGKNKFIDLYVNDTYIEVDGPFHEKERDDIVNNWILDNKKKLIRINLLKIDKYEKEIKFAELLNSIKNIKYGEIINI